MRATPRSLIVCLACAVTALSVGAAPLAACDPMWLPVARPDGISVMVALALAETVLDTVAGGIAARTHSGFGRRLDEYGGRTPGGQRVRLLGWGERDSMRWREAVLVPWAYREDCRPIAWAGRLDWMPAGTRGAVTGWLRPREHWLGGVPTLDVEMAWREPIWAESEPRWHAGASDARRMTPEEFLELYSALPTTERLERSPREVSAELRYWERDHSELAALAPATTMLAGIHRAAEAQRQSLTGRWTADVRLLEARELPLRAAATVISGELTLEPVPGDSGEVYTGSTTLDFAPLGFRLGSAEALVAVEDTTVRLILDPTVDHGHVVATLTGGRGELVGTWYLNGRPARASGTIRLRR
ncbi:MAG TPA: hypothetical protein VEB59_06235 [Gemmatimonadales bacterium]|nr:hypothetical protein [Gemmatimonadales bacterium]